MSFMACFIHSSVSADILLMTLIIFSARCAVCGVSRGVNVLSLAHRQTSVPVSPNKELKIWDVIREDKGLPKFHTKGFWGLPLLPPPLLPHINI